MIPGAHRSPAAEGKPYGNDCALMTYPSAQVDGISRKGSGRRKRATLGCICAFPLPLGREQPIFKQAKKQSPLFQSTLPVEGATPAPVDTHVDVVISIHAPREGSDLHTGCFWLSQQIFQSTLPVGGATGKRCGGIFLKGISIHAPRGGSDRSSIRPNC